MATLTLWKAFVVYALSLSCARSYCFIKPFRQFGPSMTTVRAVSGPIPIAAVQQLREVTNAGMMECRNALVECAGDVDRATKWLQARGLEIAQKKASRETKTGLLGVTLSEDRTRSVVVQLNCETDFVAKNEKFQELLSSLGNAALKLCQAGEVFDGRFVSSDMSVGEGRTVAHLLPEYISIVGENIELKRIHSFCCSLFPNGPVERLYSYVHGPVNPGMGKIAGLVILQVDDISKLPFLESIGSDLAMQIVATNPICVDETGLGNDTSPDQVLLNQDLLKSSQSPPPTVAQWLTSTGLKLGCDVKVARFVRLELS